MKKIAIATACLALAAPQVFAQARSFEGFSLSANLESTKSTVDTLSVSDSGNSTGLGLQAQYTFAITDQFVLGVGATLGTVKRNTASASGLGADAYTKDNTSFDLTPGIAVTDSMVIFGKISALGGALQVDSAPSVSYSLTGLGYGVGIKSKIDKNLFWQLVYDSNKYNDVTTSGGTTLTNKSSIFSLGVGYKF
jgi:outer membrane immunogenic protein